MVLVESKGYNDLICAVKTKEKCIEGGKEMDQKMVRTAAGRENNLGYWIYSKG